MFALGRKRTSPQVNHRVVKNVKSVPDSYTPRRDRRGVCHFGISALLALVRFAHQLRLDIGRRL